MFGNNILISSLDRIPKALSDKVFTDIKTKQAAAAKQAQNKGSKSTCLCGAECRNNFGRKYNTVPQNKITNT